MSDTTDREAAAREVYALAEGIEQGYYGNTEMVQINLPDGRVIRQVRVMVQSTTVHDVFAQMQAAKDARPTMTPEQAFGDES
jgi:hypothetical protein